MAASQGATTSAMLPRHRRNQMAKMMTLQATREFCALVNVRVAIAAGILQADDGLLLTNVEDTARDVLRALGCPARFMTVEVRHVAMLARDGHPDGLFS